MSDTIGDKLKFGTRKQAAIDARLTKKFFEVPRITSCGISIRGCLFAKRVTLSSRRPITGVFQNIGPRNFLVIWGKGANSNLDLFIPTNIYYLFKNEKGCEWFGVDEGTGQRLNYFDSRFRQRAGDHGIYDGEESSCGIFVKKSLANSESIWERLFWQKIVLMRALFCSKDTILYE